MQSSSDTYTHRFYPVIGQSTNFTFSYLFPKKLKILTHHTKKKKILFCCIINYSKLLYPWYWCFLSTHFCSHSFWYAMLVDVTYDIIIVTAREITYQRFQYFLKSYLTQIPTWSQQVTPHILTQVMASCPRLSVLFICLGSGLDMQR